MEEVVNEVLVTEEPHTEEVVTKPVPKPGEKTDSALLLKSLQEEREEKRLLKEEIATLRAAPQKEVFSDEGQVLFNEITQLKSKLASQEKAEKLSSVFEQNPILKDKAAEFDAYLQDNEGMKLETAAKAFLIENNLSPTIQTRKGLEKQSGGGRVVPSGEPTIDELDNLRTTNYRKYSDMVRKGQIKSN